MTEKKLQVHNLRISFRTVSGKVQAVRDISFDLYKGETMAIVGESGSGKSVTSKAILGIQAGNSISEGGEILYDGQDLLKINEDDFYRIRGDKIAMIFQDPLSSLNPIMRIGKQLTEAMILKGKARQRASKKNFYEKLELLEKYMCQANPAQAETIKKKCAGFRRFELRHIEMEQLYNLALDGAQDALVEIENALFLIEKNALKDPEAQIREVRESALRAVSPYLVSDRANELKANAKALHVDLHKQEKSGNYAELARKLTVLQDILTEATAKTRPDFFAMGFFLEFGRQAKPTGTIEENNKFYANYLEENYMNDFIAVAEQGVAHADASFHALREKAVAALREALVTLRRDDGDDTNGEELDQKELTALCEALCKTVDASIDPIDIVKDSAACTFSGSIRAFLDTYADGKRTNKRKNAKYQRQMAAYQRKMARGKKLDYKLPEPTTIDFKLVLGNIKQTIANLEAHYVRRLAAEAGDDKRAKTERLIAYLKENASGMVYKITKHAANNKALKLMDEVGISEPRKRFRQYPFEFSGGMRQRIVIAIALAANPDILICDEPTTALDVTIQAQILELINKLKKERDLSIIFITHDLGVVANMADRIAVMYAGKIVEYGTAEEIFYQPAHPYTWALLSSMPDLDTNEKLEAIPGTPPDMIFPPKGDAFAERNRYAMQIDFEQEPPAFRISDTHWAATWLLHPNAPKVAPPAAMVERIAKMKARLGGNANA